TEKCEVVLVLAKHHAPAAPTARCPATLARPQHFVATHDLGHLTLPVRPEGCLQQTHHGGALRGGEIPHSQSLALEDAGREVGPPCLLRAVEWELNPA